MGALGGEETEIVCERLKDHETLTELTLGRLNINENAAKWMCQFKKNFTSLNICFVSLAIVFF